jgi:uncharacterized cupin superfamily protein
MKKIDIQNAPISAGSKYPEPFATPCLNKVRYRLAIAAGLRKLGVNLLELNPGAWSSQRHWHTRTDEFIYVIEGEVVLVTQGGEEVLRAGDCAGFPEVPAVVLEIGSAGLPDDETHYPDIDLHATATGYSHKDGTPYRRRSRVKI